MLYEILAALGVMRSYSGRLVHSVRRGHWEIVDGSINLSLPSGQYFIIDGSVQNDGVYCFPADLHDEEFDGTIITLVLPKAFLELVHDIEKFQETQSNPAYTSESFGGYSYSKATASNGAAVGWREAYAARLSPWRVI